MNQLVVFFGAIGDTILFSPALKELSKKGDVFVVGYPERMSLLEKVGWVKKTFSPEDIDFTSLFSSPSERLRTFLANFDVVFLFLRNADVLVNKVKDIGIAHVYAFGGTPPEDWSLHAVDYYLHCLGCPSITEFVLPIKPGGYHGNIIIHPGSGSPKKNMPCAFFEELTDRLQCKGLPVCWCLGPAEETLEVPKNVQIYKESNLVRLTEYIGGGSVFIGNDSGISHIAGAVGVNTLVLFRTTNPNVWKPLGPNVYIFKMEDAIIPKVIDTIFHLYSNQ
ncbi:MAG TPA: glycosyltransferase family 9 protein [Candidatus Hydrogenedens sp.]|nr:glycosyltransferase family 9 protein [Candidatus Hydrogenedens sp.]HOL19514.1 glycosyltransferase family 9 protein [Candidatus Hydrogenedens sp.]HPP59382.1 glycosyltransferase family 9 protein [Candidatus Hydrogenedens sp.]